MKNSEKIKQDLQESSTEPESTSRRKAVKTIIGGLTALTAYHTLPVNWSKPVIEQVFLPAHAATSGDGLVDPSIPVTPGHPDHPDYPLPPDHPDHPHSDPSAVIGNITFTEFSPFVRAAVEFTVNRIAKYTIVYTNTSVPASDPDSTETNFFTAQTIPTTLSPGVSLKGSAGDTFEVTITNSVDSEVITKTVTITF